MRKWVLIGVGVFLLLVTVGGFVRYQSVLELRRLPISGVTAQGVSDGTYIASYGNDVMFTTLAVTVRQGRIADIVIQEPRQGLGKAGAQMVAVVLSAQSTGVDTVTGATATSKLLLKAVEQALAEGMR